MSDINYNALPEKLTHSVTWDKVLIIDSEDGDIVKQQDALQFKWDKGDVWDPWTDAPATQFQYSIDGSTSWHSTFTTWDKYLRTSVDGWSTWSAGIKFVWENGTWDMNKSVYDTDNDWVVDDSERLWGQLPSYYATWGGTATGTNTWDNAANSNTGLVHTTWDETIGGTKTFSSDVIVPDEAYWTWWNWSLEVPTKNAVYDKIETISWTSALTVFPMANFPLSATPYSNTWAIANSNTTMTLWLFYIDKITINKISIFTGTVTTGWDVWISIYSEDWATRVLNDTINVTTTLTLYTKTISSPVSLSSWNYWIWVFPIWTTNTQLSAVNRNSWGWLTFNTTWEPPFCWTITITASTSPSTITPTSITTWNVALMTRFDN